MHNWESILENEIYKFHRDFEIKTDHLILAKLLDLVRIPRQKKKTKKKNRISE